MKLNSTAHEVTQSPEYLAMFQLYDQKFAPIAREIFIAELDKTSKNMVNRIMKLVEANHMELGGIGIWLTIYHDIWITINIDGALVSSLKLTTKEMHIYTIAAVLEKKNDSHGAKDVTGILQILYQARYNINLMNESTYIVCDTCTRLMSM